jgi:hypothetical protein
MNIDYLKKYLKYSQKLIQMGGVGKYLIRMLNQVAPSAVAAAAAVQSKIVENFVDSYTFQEILIDAFLEHEITENFTYMKIKTATTPDKSGINICFRSDDQNIYIIPQKMNETRLCMDKSRKPIKSDSRADPTNVYKILPSYNESGEKKYVIFVKQETPSGSSAYPTTTYNPTDTMPYQTQLINAFLELEQTDEYNTMRIVNNRKNICFRSENNNIYIINVSFDETRLCLNANHTIILPLKFQNIFVKKTEKDFIDVSELSKFSYEGVEYIQLIDFGDRGTFAKLYLIVLDSNKLQLRVIWYYSNQHGGSYINLAEIYYYYKLSKSNLANLVEGVGYKYQSDEDIQDLFDGKTVNIVSGHMADVFLPKTIKGTSIEDRLHKILPIDKVSDTIIDFTTYVQKNPEKQIEDSNFTYEGNRYIYIYEYSSRGTYGGFYLKQIGNSLKLCFIHYDRDWSHGHGHTSDIDEIYNLYIDQSQKLNEKFFEKYPNLTPQNLKDLFAGKTIQYNP